MVSPSTLLTALPTGVYQLRFLKSWLTCLIFKEIWLTISHFCDSKDNSHVYIFFLLLFSNKECPTCRKKLVSKRSLRPDPNFDALISKIYPSRDEYEAHQERVLARINKHNNQQALSHSIEEGLKIQAMNRYARRGEGSCPSPLYTDSRPFL